MKTVVFLVCSGIGYLLARYLPEGAWSAYAPMLISYHLYLAFLVLTGEHKAGFSMPLFSTILTHSAFLALLIGLAFGRHSVPFFGLIRIFVPALAPFESQWLFSGGKPKKEAKKDTSATEVVDLPAVDLPAVDPAAGAPVGAVSTTAASTGEASTTSVVSAVPESGYSADEHTAWIRYLSQPRRGFRKPGLSVEEEFKQWRAARAQYHAMLSQNQPPD